MSEPLEAALKVVTILGALYVLVRMARARNDWFERHRRQLLLGATALGAVCYVNFGGFHSDGSPLHLWDQIHYFLGSKYYPELGYDGLYVALVSARRDADGHIPARMRDLRSFEVAPTTQLREHEAEVRARFSGQRWSDFVADTSALPIRDELFLDHGYLPTPSHTAVSRLFSSWLPLRTRWLLVCASLDFLLLGVAGWALYAWAGIETLASAALIFGLGYCSRYYWVGGAFLRQDWFSALLISAAALRGGRARVAGLALGYAAMVRVFPGLCLLPLIAYGSLHVRSNSARAVGLRFASGMAASVIILFVAGGFAGRGFGAWRESAVHVVGHARKVFPNAIGLRVPLITSWDNLRGALVAPSSLYELKRISADYQSLLQQRYVLIGIVSVASLAFVLRVARRAPDAAAALACGAAVIFVLTTPTCYYGSYFVLLALVRPLWSARLFLVGTLAMYTVAAAVFMLAGQGVIRLNGAAVYAPISLLLAALLLVWLTRVPTATDLSLGARTPRDPLPPSPSESGRVSTATTLAHRDHPSTNFCSPTPKRFLWWLRRARARSC